MAVGVYSSFLSWRPARHLLLLFGAVVATTTSAADINVFGPATYTSAGRPVFVQRTFNVDSGGEGFLLRVRNSGVTRGLIVLNDEIVIRPRDLGAVGPDDANVPWRELRERLTRDRESVRGTPVPLVEKPVVLRDRANSIAVAFVAPRGASLTVEIVRPAPPDRTPPFITTSSKRE